MAYDFCDDTFSDLVKEVYGSRGPARSGHLSHYYDSTPAEKQKIWDDLAEQLRKNEAEEREAEQLKIADFESRIEDVVNLGAGDRKTALRWIASQETFYHGQCVEHFVWELGVLFTDYGRKLLKELADVVLFDVFRPLLPLLRGLHLPIIGTPALSTRTHSIPCRNFHSHYQGGLVTCLYCRQNAWFNGRDE